MRESGIESGEQPRRIPVAAHPSEVFLRFQQCGADPTLDHGSASPALDVAGEGSDRAVEILDRVGRRQGPCEGAGDAQALDGERLLESFTQRGGGPRMVALERAGETLELALGELGTVGTPRVADCAPDARVQLLGCGSILREVIEAAALLKADFDIDADVWSAPSFNELARDGQSCHRWNRMHPEQSPRKSWVEQCLDDTEGPVVAASDYIKTLAEQIRPFVRARYEVLGTDGYGRSDSREALRSHFEVDRHHVVLAALKALADEGKIKRTEVREAIDRYQIDADKPEPLHS